MENKEQRGEEGFHLNKKIEQNELARRSLLIENTKYLDKILKKKLYKEILGDDKAEWVAYLAQIEVFYTRAKVRKLLKIFEKFGDKISEVIDIPITRLLDISQLNDVDFNEWFEKARVLTSRDWRIELRKLKNLPTSDDCEHKWQPYQICKVCGEKMKA